MNSAADLDGTFIVLDVTTLAFAQIINMRETARTLRDTHWIMTSSKEATVKPVKAVLLLSVML